MNNLSREAFVIFTASLALTGMFVSSENTHQDIFAQKICESALFASGDDIKKQMEMIQKNERRCKFLIKQADRKMLGRWFMGIVLSTIIVNSVSSMMKDK